jgi:hypothetical protein
MNVILLTASPPQLIAQTSEDAVSSETKLRAFLQGVNARRHIRAQYAGIFEWDGGKLDLWIFDTFQRAQVFIDRNDVPIIATKA